MKKLTVNKTNHSKITKIQFFSQAYYPKSFKICNNIAIKEHFGAVSY